MVRTLPLIMGILVALVLGFLYFGAPQDVLRHFDDATSSDRCERFRQPVLDDDASDYEIGYGGRIQQLFYGCF